MTLREDKYGSFFFIVFFQIHQRTSENNQQNS